MNQEEIGAVKMFNKIVETQAYIPLIIGLCFIVWGIFYKKSNHEKLGKRNEAGGGYNGSLIGDIIYEILAFIPWYILEILLFIFGLAFVGMCFMTI
ncbi:hypothetical protein [Gottfriedia solisilvae]|uniref:hypothetical protein n=1 Tax=Gottfriedia solisilvae TaxID=1516104 RepID=UPI003D2F1B08